MSLYFRIDDCDCTFSYLPRGCKIAVPAPSNKACKCTNQGPWSSPVCSGELVKCLNSSSEFCTKPDDSYASCAQGQGDCSGYWESAQENETEPLYKLKIVINNGTSSSATWPIFSSYSFILPCFVAFATLLFQCNYI